MFLGTIVHEQSAAIILYKRTDFSIFWFDLSINKKTLSPDY